MKMGYVGICRYGNGLYRYENWLRRYENEKLFTALLVSFRFSSVSSVTGSQRVYAIREFESRGGVGILVKRSTCRGK